MKPPAKRKASPLKIILTTGLGLLLLLICGLAVLTFIDLDRFREPIASRLSETTGLKVQFESLNLEFTQGIGFRCGGLRVGSEDGSRDLFSAESMSLLAELPPLLNKQLKIKKITIVQPRIKVYPKSPAHEAAPPPASETTRIIEKKSQENEVAVQEFKETLRKADLNLEHIEIRQGEIVLMPDASQSPQGREVPVNVSLEMKIHRPSPQHMDASIDSLQLAIGDLQFRGNLLAKDLLAADSLVTADLKSDPVSLSQMRQVAAFFPDLKIPEELQQGTVEQISVQMQTPLQAIQDLNALRQQAEVNFAVDIHAALYQTPDAKLPFPQLRGQGHWKHPVLTQNFSGEVFGGQIQEKGTVTFSASAKEKSSLLVNSDVTFNGLDFTLLPIPKENKNAFPSQGKTSGALNFKGPIQLGTSGTDLSALRWNGAIQGENLALGKDAVHQIGQARVKIKEGSLQRTSAEVELNRLLVKDIPLKKVWANVQVESKVIDLIAGKIWPEHGEIRLTGNLDGGQEVYSLKIQGQQLRVEDLTQNALAGPANFSGRFHGRLTPEKGAKKTQFDHFAEGLSGDFKLDLADGTIQKLAPLKTLLVLLNPSTALEMGKSGLDYKFIGGDIKIRKGLMATNNFNMDGPQLKLWVDGKAQLPTGKIRAELKAMPLQMLDGLVNSVPVLGELLTGGKKGGVIETYFKVTGTFDEPRIALIPHKSITEKSNRLFEGLSKIPKSLADLQKE